jgi:hypothetical protein
MESIVETTPPNWPHRMRTALASPYLRAVHGVPAAPQTMARWRVEGGGPAYRLCGRFPIYERKDLDTWAESRLTKAHASSTAHRVAKAQQAP